MSISCIQHANAQDFSNKGRDFWVAYGYHVRFVTGNPVNAQEMVLYFATEAVTNVTVSIPDLGYSKTYSNIPANTIFTTSPLPKYGSADARLLTEGISDKGIHITSDEPVVAYAHIYNNSVSGATLLFPTNTLGQQYYSINFDQKSNDNYSYPYFYVIAADTGTTTIEVTPSANTQTMTAGQTYSFSLKQGQVLNVFGDISGKNGVDLTASKIRSVGNSGMGCKRIAVFSGSGKIYINCNSSDGKTADNYMVQAFPQTAWGKYYLTVPTKNLPFNFFRIAVSDPSTVVRMNGTVLTGLVNNFYYQQTTTAPAVIEADKPITVAQYITAQGACGNGSPGDPEVIYLSPVEQNIDRVILNSTPNYKIVEHFINVVIPNRGTGVSSFKLDGAPPTAAFIVDPQNSHYSYTQIPVGPGQHIIQSDSGFNATAYGYGKYESYGYNAGTNIKDFYQYISIHNKYATVNFPAGCRGTPLNFYMTLPYQPLRLSWEFSGLFPDTVINNPSYDSTWVVNGRTLYQYKLNKPYIFHQSGTYSIVVVAENPTADGCNGVQKISYDLSIFDPPKAVFTIAGNSCAADTVHFLDNTTDGTDRKITKWAWDFGDGSLAAVKNPVHKYITGGAYTTKLSVINDIGCTSDTATRVIDLGNTPTAKFEVSSPHCAGKNITFSDLSDVTGNTPITKRNWDFGDGTVAVLDTGTSCGHRYSAAGKYKVSLVAETGKGCASIAFSRDVVVSDQPKAGFIAPKVCLADASAPFIDTSSVASGNIASWQWDFGDADWNTSNPDISTQQNPSHKYSKTRSYTAQLIVTTHSGCTDSVSQSFTVNGSVPEAGFTVTQDSKLCSNLPVSITNTSSVGFGKIVKLEIYWDNLHDPSQTTIDETPVNGKTYIHSYPVFHTPATRTYQIRMVAYSGISCFHEMTKNITVSATPELKFDPVSPVCSRVAPFPISQASVTNGLTGSGTFSGSGITPAGLFDPAMAAAGSHVLTYTYRTLNGCVDSVSRSVEVYPTPEAHAGADTVVLEGGSVTLSPVLPTAVQASYLWSPSTGLSNPTILNPVASPADDMTYTLKVSSGKGCSSSDAVFVKVLKKPLIPNAFSPNGDGINDLWRIKYLETYPGVTVEIYNRYGQILFRSAGYARPWDGKYKGQNVPTGTYYYIIDPKNGRKKMTGFVDVLR
ncbi:MAG TPA: PKD domain-containing protein [Chitinophagaceae bacterium]|nr:PKD domain-containing protein [Chitinophagaceae bacterium]